MQMIELAGNVAHKPSMALYVRLSVATIDSNSDSMCMVSTTSVRNASDMTKVYDHITVIPKKQRFGVTSC